MTKYFVTAVDKEDMWLTASKTFDDIVIAGRYLALICLHIDLADEKDIVEMCYDKNIDINTILDVAKTRMIEDGYKEEDLTYWFKDTYWFEGAMIKGYSNITTEKDRSRGTLCGGYAYNLIKIEV